MLGMIAAWFAGKKKPTPSAPELPVAPAVEKAEAPAADAPIDFVGVLTAAGVPAEVRARVVKAKQLIRALPADGTSATKRQSVEAAFKAFEIPTQKIIDGAAAEIEALRAYIRSGEEEKDARLAEGEGQIANLE